MAHFSERALDELIHAMKAGHARLRGGCTTDQGWRIIVSDGVFLLESWNDEQNSTEHLSEQEVRDWAQRYGPGIVVR